MSQLEDVNLKRNNFLPQKIGLENFKAFGVLQRVRLKPITLLYGKNSSGKSSFIQSLLYLKGVKAEGKFDLKNTKFGNFGGFDRFIHGRNDGKALVFQFDIEDEAVSEAFTVRLEITRNKEQATRPVQLKQILFLSAEEDEPFVKLVCSSNGRYSVHFEKSSEIFINLVDQRAECLEAIDDFFECVPTDNFLMPDRVITKREKEPTDTSREVRERLENFFNRTSTGISEFLDNISYLSGNRTVADQGILDGAGLSNDEEDSGGLLYWEKIRRDPKLRDKVNEHLRLLFENRYEIVAEDFYSIESISGVLSTVDSGKISEIFNEFGSEEFDDDGQSLPAVAYTPVAKSADKDSVPASVEGKVEGEEQSTDENKINAFVEESFQECKGDRSEIRILDTHSKSTPQLRLLPNELGFGVGQVIPIIAAACLPGRTVIVEQPETHLHPKQQADLGEILASSLALQAEGGEGSTFIIETHSINILERLGKIIRETSKEKDFKGLRLKPGEVGVYYVDAEETTSVKLRRMELRDDGKLKRKWPGEFFNEDMNDLF